MDPPELLPFGGAVAHDWVAHIAWHCAELLSQRFAAVV